MSPLKGATPAFLNEPALCDRFLREARSLALLSHPNIVPIYQTGEVQGLPYLVFDYCPMVT